ncbi:MULTISPECIES: ABC transporter ATP-binding protein [unclassified Niallia]|uniref:ABC transporter ATP-binding protein n=1 Tax=unclassified Niallia TaxID=2837522 RepID=UPI0020418864|nr:MULTISPECIES: ABC transporter ATP-binding protein [unclassified Niallia]MCM3029763.1 ABC transporter ATP-binding protein [Niallia sp. MER 6]MDL0437668.1 ABC transporter ATP-binding protein [Niallia sp. SS-2023]
MTAIKAQKMTKVYNGVTVVNGIDLKVEKGEIFGFLGRNGAGKSTFINMLTGIAKPTSGSFTLLNGDTEATEVKRRIGVMPDYSTFYGSTTALEHLRFFSSLSGKPAQKSACMEALEAVGLAEHANKKAGKFSFGMKKKLGVAQAIIHDPELLFLDEPTSGMDAESVIQIQRLIKSLHNKGKTIFLTSHNLDEVEKLCTRIAIMKEGRIVKIGTMDELRAFYRTNIIVKIRHSIVPVSEEQKLRQWLEGKGTDVQFGDKLTFITVDEDKKIAEITRAFTACKTDIFRVEVEEPTLEEIFLD